jgi:uncharacterized protein
MPPRIRFFVVLGLVLSVLAGLHAYVANRLLLEPELPGPVVALGSALLVALFASVVAAPIVQRRGSPRLARVLAWPAFLWLGVGFLLLVALAASDLFWWALGGPVLAAGRGEPLPEVELARLRGLGVLGVVGLGTAVGMLSAARGPRLRRVEVRLRRAAPALDGFRIVQITDLHIGPILRRTFLASVVARVNALEPDLVAVTGDLVDGSVDSLAPELDPLRELRSRHGAFYVSGNHERYSGHGAWLREIAARGLRVLRGERLRIEHGAGALELAGVDDAAPREELEKALADRDPTLPLVLLAHDPLTFRSAAPLGVDLQLSGHTHGGQIWPFRYLVRLAQPWVSGLHSSGAAQLYVSRGTGFWGPPMRLFAPAEITEITLRAAPAK